MHQWPANRWGRHRLPCWYGVPQQLIVDVVPGRGFGFSVEAPEGVRFLTRSRVFTDGEVGELSSAGISVAGRLSRSFNGAI